MKKNIAYYLEDNSRLKEISEHDLNQWVEEMPYSQPLRLLSKMKSDQLGTIAQETPSAYGAYFAEDYEPFIVSKKGKKKKSKKTEEDVTPEVSTESENTTIAALAVAVAVPKLSTEEEVVKTEKSEPVEIAHDLANDFGEDTLEEDLLEVNPNTELVNEINHVAADESLEDSVELEVLEVFDSEVDEVSSFSELYEDSDTLEEKVDVENVVVGNVDYSSFVSNVIDSEVDAVEDGIESMVEESVASEEVSQLPEVIEKVLERAPEDNEVESLEGAEEVDQQITLEPEEETESIVDPEEATIIEKVKGKKSKKSKKSKSSKKKKKEKAEVKVKKEDKKKKKKKSKQEALKKKDKKKKKSKKKAVDKKSITTKVKKAKKAVKAEKSEVKSVKGELKVSRPSKTISIKGEKRKKVEAKTSDDKAKKRKDKSSVKYVIVNESINKDFKLKDYDGVSSYTNWLLEQESINGKKDLEVVGKKNKKSKKKKSKSKVPKVATDSLKRSSTIISEPLADILAMQGHKKKAAKMYTQLGLIFPEKSSYFAAKIKNLKNK